ncbi:MAG: Gfo/Idh/MocA family oxidoreductase [Chloroflexi bacterium]|nr:Gfo/Idh/MocA family oxidoreductase [Chloroflexota bacterium]
MTVGWAFIGTGRHTTGRMMRAITEAEGAELVAVQSRDLARAQTLAAAAAGGCRAYDSYDDVLRDDRVEAIYLATPNSLHASQTLAAAAAGKHVLCEKPMALSVPDAQSMVEACDRAGVQLGVGFHMRAVPAHVEARQLIAEGAAGPVELIQVLMAGPRYQRPDWYTPEMAGAFAMMARGVHVLDLLRFISGQEIVEVSALTDGQTSEQPLEEMALGLARFENGALASFGCGMKIPVSRNDVEVFCANGRISCVGSVDVNGKGDLVVDDGTSAQSREFSYRFPYTVELEVFSRAVHGHGEPLATGRDGLRVVEVTTAYLDSAWTGLRRQVRALL